MLWEQALADVIARWAKDVQDALARADVAAANDAVLNIEFVINHHLLNALAQHEQPPAMNPQMV